MKTLFAVLFLALLAWWLGRDRRDVPPYARDSTGNGGGNGGSGGNGSSNGGGGGGGSHGHAGGSNSPT